MTSFTSRVPKHPTNPDRTLEAILEDIKFRNENGDKLVHHDIHPTEVILTYEG